MSEEPLPRKAVGSLLGLLVHDLRNPAATLSANVEFLDDVEFDDPDAREALDDMKLAVAELSRGLEQVGWVASWLSSHEPFADSAGDVATAVEAHFARIGKVGVSRVDAGPFVARGGAAAARLAEALVANAREHARTEPRIELRREAEHVVVSIRDGGRAIGEEKRALAFTLEGQGALKGTADGRYGRYLGLLAVQAAMATLGGTARAGGVDGDARLELWFRAV